MSAELVPSEGCEREPGPRLSPNFRGGLLSIIGVPKLVETSPQSLPSSSCGVLPVCMSGSTFLLFRGTSVILG